MSPYYKTGMLEIELLAMSLGMPVTVYAEHYGYIAPSMIVLTAQEIDALLDGDDDMPHILKIDK